jgi:subtilisin family serine protease
VRIPVLQTLLVVTAVAMLGAPGAAARLPQPAPVDASARVVIGVRSPGDVAALRSAYRLTDVRPVPALRAAIVDVSKFHRRGLAADSRVRYVSPFGAHRRSLAMPNDPLLSTLNPASGLPYEWQFAAAHVDRALELSPGSPSVVVGIIDTGLGDVPDLAGKVDGRWAFSTDGRLTPVPSAVANDSAGHGTAVASLVAANAGDGFGMAGFGGATHVISFKADPQNFSDAALAIAIAKLDALGARIINMSVGGQQPAGPILLDAIHQAARDGVLIVASTGNDHSFSGHPAADLQPGGGLRSYGLAVGASDADDRLAFFSNSGNHLSLLAPGDFRGSCSGVAAAIPAQSEFDRSCYTIWTAAGARYAFLAGTSFAAPEVSGVAGLIWAARPELTNSQVADIIKQSARRDAGAGWTQAMGCGVLDAGAALELTVGRRADGWVEAGHPETASCSGRGAARPTWPPLYPVPTVRALRAAGAWNEPIALSFRLDEDTHVISPSILVQRNRVTVKRLKSGFFKVEPGAIYALTWRTPAAPTGGTYRFCVTLTGPTRARSTPSCARIDLASRRR